MNKKLIAIIISAVVAVLLIVAGIFVAMNKIHLKNPSSKNTNNSSSVNQSTVSGQTSETDKTDDNSSVSKDNGSTTNKTEKTDDNTQGDVEVIEKGDVKIEDKEVTSGDTIDIPINITNNPGIAIGMFNVLYDSKVFDYVDVEKSKAFDQVDVNAKPGNVKCLVETSKMKDVKGDVSLLTFKLKVKSGAKKGDYNIKIVDSSFVNYGEKIISPKISDGKITVK